MLKVILLFAVGFLLVIGFFGFLLKKEYQWIKATASGSNKISRIVSKLVCFITAMIGILVVAVLAFYFIFAVAMCLEAEEHKKIVNLNDNTTPLKVGETWTIDDKGTVTVNSLVPLSDEELQEKYGKIANETEKYYEISFDYENVAFDGHIKEGRVIENEMSLSVYVGSDDVNGEVAEAWLDTYNEKDFYYAPRGSIVRDNRFLIIVKDVESHTIDISFTAYTPDKYGIYRQHYMYEMESV